MQRQIGHEPPITPRLRRRRQMRRCGILSMMVVLLATAFLMSAYTGFSYSWRDNREPQGKDQPPNEQDQPKYDQIALNDEDNALQAAPRISQETELFLSEMARRMEAVKNVCRADGDGVTHESVTGHIAADDKEKFLYCVVPHPPSGARLAYRLQQSDLWNPQLDEQGGLSKSRYPPLPLDFNPGLQEYLYVTRFLITRHPLQRLLECYTSKFESGKDVKYYKLYGKTMVTKFRERPRDMSAREVAQLLSKVDDDSEREQTLGNLYANPKGPTFTEFVQYVVNSTLLDDVLWRPIHQHCAPCSIQYNYILSFENLDEEGDQLMMVLKATLTEKPKKDGVLVGPPSDEASSSYFSQLTNKLLLQLLRKYDTELRMFNFSKDLYTRCADEYVRQ